jgi:hypothetical protein
MFERLLVAGRSRPVKGNDDVTPTAGSNLGYDG